jgi:oligoribonuclease NrnB/cAMP/cGMP phosphodiesterase (DHH superfamily)
VEVFEMKCFYHSADLDGKCSGAIIHRKFPECGMLGYNYEEEFPWEAIEKNEMVFMVDVSLPMEQMQRLNSMCRLVWIDHHKTAIDAAHRCGLIAYAKVLEVGKAACELTWRYCYPDVVLPYAVFLLGRYDVWDLRNREVLPFQYGMRTKDTYPTTQIWETVLSPGGYLLVDSIVTEGSTILSYVAMDNKNYIQDLGFETVIDGGSTTYTAFAVNKGHTSSQLFDSISKEYDMFITFVWIGKNDKYRVSLYSETVDVGVVALKYGGGGHKKAAGFVCDVLPFNL